MSLTITPSMPVPAAMHLLAPSMAVLPAQADLPMQPGALHVSPLVIADSLLTLAEHADRAGFPKTASDLLTLVFTVLDESGVPN